MNNKLVAVTVAVFAVALALSYALNAFGVFKFSFTPPYYYASNDFFGVANAFAFSFVFSLLFFGYGAPVAALIEGVKTGSLFAAGALGLADAAFALPSLLAAVAGIALGQGALHEWRGTGSFFENWDYAVKAFAAGAALLGALLVVKSLGAA